jgi:hypothetical protein
MAYGRRVAKQKGKKSEFTFEAHPDVVGEIRLEKNPPDNICNACQTEQVLTLDHVPPQGTGNRRKWQYQSYFNHITNPKFKKQFTQNGLSWQSVCRSCHTKIGRFDTAICDLYSRLKAQYKVKGRPYLPIAVRPAAIIRGTLMHFLSAKSYHTRCVSEDLFANLLDDDSYKLPDKSHFYLFPFMQKQIRVFNGLGLPLDSENIVLVHCVKIYPIAMLWSDSALPLEGLYDWNCWYKESVDTEAYIKFPAVMPVDDEFPERYLFGSGMQLLGQSSVESVIAWSRK